MSSPPSVKPPGVTAEILQACTATASIAAGFYAALYAVVLSLPEAERNIPPWVFWGLGISGCLSLFASVSCLLKLMEEQEVPIVKILDWKYWHFFWLLAAIVVLGLPLIALVVTR